MKLPIKALTAALLTLLTGNLAAMSISGSVIFDYIFIDTIGLDKVQGLMIVIPASLITLFMSAYWLYSERQAFFPIRTIEQRSLVKPHRALVILLSDVDSSIEKDNKIRIKVKDASIELSGDLKDDKDDNRLSEARWSWQQLLRALYPHKDALEMIYLIPSDRSIKKIDDIKSILASYGFKNVKHHQGIDFEQFTLVKDAIDHAIKELRTYYKDDDIIVDITGGQKTASIAAAIAIINNYIKMQYVETNPPFNVLAYNVIAEVPPELS